MKITTGKMIKPLAILVYGIHGIGKTNFGKDAPKSIYVGSENNDEAEISRMPRVNKWSDLEENLKWLVEENHDYKTLVVDTIDTLEEVAQKSILAGQSGKTMATAFGGYGKAYEKMADMFLEIRDKYLVKLREEKNMNIVLLSHEEKNKHEDPMTATTYDCYTTAIHKKIKPIFENWVSVILFATWQVFKVEGNDGKERAVGDGTRILLSEERPSHIAKNRFELPYEMEFPKDNAWQLVAGYVKEYYASGKSEKEPEQKLAVKELLEKLTDPEMKEKIVLSLTRAGDDEKELTRIYKKLEKLVK